MESEELLDLNIKSEKKTKCRMIFLISLIIILLVLFIVFLVLYIQKNKNKDEKDTYKPLSLWNDCEAKEKLMKFMGNITSSLYFVPKEDRIAVFDLDGTLFQETDLVYDDWKLYYYRVYNDSTFEASDDLKKIADDIDKAATKGTMPEDLNMRIANTYGELFKDMSLEEYDIYVKNFVNQPAEGYENLKRGDAFYKPMLEVIEYLQKNDFNVFITSGTDRYQVRAVIEGHINIPKSNVIGSDYELIATNQGIIKGNEYEYQKNDTFNFQGTFLRKNLKTNKVTGIIREIGKQPILAFGNSGGDSCMANYVINNNKYDSLAFMLLCDDLERENGNIQKATSMEANCRKNGWIPISMKNNWKTIYGDNVKRKTKL